MEQPRAVATRAALLRAGGDQFAACGYHRASLRRIVEQAGLTKGALYFHFAGKQALADEVITETIATAERLVAGVEAQRLDPLTTLIVETEQVVEAMLTDPVVRGGTRLLNDPLTPTAWAGAHYRYAEDAVRTQLAAAAMAGVLRPHVDLGELARSFVALIVGQNLICERTGTLDDLAGQVRDMWRGLLPLIATDTWLRTWQDTDGRST